MTPVLGARPNGAVQEGGGQMYRESPHLPCLVCLSVVTVVFQSCVCCSPSLMSFLHCYIWLKKKTLHASASFRITALQHLIDPRQMASLKEPYDGQRKVRLLYCFNQAWMKNRGLILWDAIAICEMSKTSRQKGKHCTKDDLENHSKGQ